MASTASSSRPCRRGSAGTMRASTSPASFIVAERAIGEGLVVAALLGWWLLARGLPEFILPNPLAVGRRLVDLFITPDFLQHTLASSWRVLVSVVAALVIGAALAFVAHTLPVLEAVVN